MDPSFYQLAAAAGYGEARMDILTNNLANAGTGGFKADQLSFSEALDAATGAPVIGATQYVDPAAGPVEQTGGPFDAAIDGDGYFVVETPDGRRFTRDGAFRLSEDGTLVTRDGDPVQGSGGAISIDPQATSVHLDGAGRVWVDEAQVAQLDVVTFPAGSPPAKVGGNLFDGTGDTPVENPKVIPGALEGSNVSVIAEMSRMIEIARGYEAYQKLIQTLDATAGQTNEVGSV
jgi:flagellar basal-body rod protein FlgF